MKNFAKLVLLISVPILISLSWLLGGNLIQKVTPLALSSARVGISVFILFFFANLRQQFKDHNNYQILKWWKQQAILAITGRALYYYLSAESLTTITPFEAVLISTLLPLFSLAVEKTFSDSSTRLNPASVFMTFVTCFLAAITLWSKQSGLSASVGNTFRIGHLEMVLAMVCFAIHLLLYKKWVKDAHPANVLFVQFAIAALFLIPLDLQGLKAFFSFQKSEWIQFFFYTVVCGLLPFILVHYLLKMFSPFAVASVALLSPVFAMLCKSLYTADSLPMNFIISSLATCLSLFITLYVKDKVSIRMESRT